MDASAREDFLEDRVELWCDRLRAEGVEAGRTEGIETGRAEGIAAARAEERAHLVHLAELKFDSNAARRLAELLARTNDAARLAEVGGWIITCATAGDLLARAAGNSKDQ